METEEHTSINKLKINKQIQINLRKSTNSMKPQKCLKKSSSYNNLNTELLNYSWGKFKDGF